jgi:transcriptional regulator with XRE-family HTH domain
MSNEVQQLREALGFRLRDIRKDARLSGRGLATLAGWHFTKVSKIEHGRATPSEADIELWCFHCGADSQIPELIVTARGVEKMYVELKRLMQRGTSRYQRELLDSEIKARYLRIFDPAIIPGALQIPAYTRARLAEFADMVGIPVDMDDTIAARQERGRLLLTGERLFHVVLVEHALRAALAEPDVMQEQLLHLQKLSRLPRVRLGIVPTRSRHYMTFCGFWIFDDREVHLETYSAAIRVSQPREIAMYSKVFDHYASRALHGDEARELIGQVITDPPESPAARNLQQQIS